MKHLHTLFARRAGTEEVPAIVEWLVVRIRPVRGAGRLRHRLANMLVHDRASQALQAVVTAALSEEEAREFRAALAAPFAEQRARIEAAARAAFRPHVWVLHERNTPSSITMFALANGVARWQRISLPPDIAGWPPQAQQAEVARVVAQHRAANDASPFLGAITGYHYRPDYDTAFEVRADGSLQATAAGRAGGAEAVVGLG